MGIFFFIVGLLMFIGLVVFHEFGHYILARRNGIDVEEFGVGFPPRAKVLRRRKGTVFTLNWLPLGGFVRLKGEHDEDKSKGTFGAASTLVKSKVMLAGVAMNLIAALILFTIVALTGMPALVDNQFTVESDTKVIREIENKGVVKIDYIVEDSPASRAGLAANEEIISIAGRNIDKPEQLSEATSASPGEVVSVLVKNGDSERVLDIKLNDSAPYLGVAPYSDESGFELRRSTWSAPIVAVGVSRDFTVATFKGLGTALKGLGSTLAGLFTGNKEARQSGQEQASNQVAGPVGIFAVLYNISQEGFGLVLFIIAIISLTLAIMNVLPIPALDGGRLFVMLLFRSLKRPLKASTEDKIHGTGFAVLMLLFIIITVVDVRRF